MKEIADIQREVSSVLSERRTKAVAAWAERYSEVCRIIPSYEEVSNNIKRAGIRLGRLAVDKKTESPEYEALKNEIGEMSVSRIELLKNAGFEENYLEDVCFCPVCKDSGEVSENGAKRVCGCYMELYTEKLQKESNLDHKDGFEAFSLKYYGKESGKDGKSPYEKAEYALSKARFFVEKFGTESAKNMLFLGGTGVGKSFLCSCIACELVRRGVPVLYMSVDEVFATLMYYGNDEERKARRELLEKVIYSVELLVLDDLGAEKQSAARYSLLVELLNRRAGGNNLRRRTIISSNLSLKKLKEEFYDERIFSRLIAFDICELTGDDIRIKKKIEENN